MEGPRDIVAGLYGVSKFFDTFWGGNLVRALTNVNIEVRRGEILGLLGPAGAGKSTAMRILAGKLRAMEGKAEVFGRSPRSGAVKSRVGYLPPRIVKPSEAASKTLRGSFDELVETGKRGAFEVVGARLMRALLKEPDLLLLDDPFDGIDPSGLEELKRQIRGLAVKGRTVVLTSRSLDEVNRLCDRVAVFRGGKVEAAGTLEELLALSGAVNLLAPVLTPTMVADIVQVIRQNLQQAETSAAEIQPILSSSSESLVKPSATVSPSEVPKPAADSINHERLAELAKPAARVERA